MASTPEPVIGNNHRIPMSQKLAYGASTFGGSIHAVAGGMGFFYVTQYVGLDPLILGSLQMIPTIYDAVIDPIIGAMSDRVMTRWGRRRPFVFIGGLLALIGGMAGWVVPPVYVHLAQIHGFSMFWLYAFIFCMSFYDRTCSSVSHMAYCALGAEMSDLPEERNKIAAVRAATAQIGKLIGLPIGKWAVATWGIKVWLPLYFALIPFTLGGLILTVMFCKERIHLEPKGKQKPPAWRDMVELFSYRPYVVFVIAFIIAMFGFGFSGQFMAFLGRFWLLDNTAVMVFMFFAFVSTLVSLLFWPRIIRNMGAKRAYLIMLSLMGFGYLAGYYFIKPYCGPPEFVNGKVESLPKRWALKALTLSLSYTGQDIENIGELKKAAKKSELAGSRWFADMDPAKESDADFLGRLNALLERPSMYGELEDKPLFEADSFADYALLAKASRDKDSVLSVFLEGRPLPGQAAAESTPASSVGGVSIQALNRGLDNLSFYAKVKKRIDLKTAPKTLPVLARKAIPARLKSELKGLAGSGAKTLDLAQVPFTIPQAKSLYEILDIKRKIDADSGVLPEKERRRLVKELRKSLGLVEARESFLIASSLTTTDLEPTDFQRETVRQLNRTALEAVYGKALKPWIRLNMEKADDKLMLLVIRTKNTRVKPFDSLSQSEQGDVRTLNRMLLRHLFPKLVNDAVPGWSLAWFCLIALYLGAFNGALTIMPGVVIPDIADADEERSGRRRMAVLFGVESFTVSMFTMVIPPLKGAFLAYLGAREKIDLSATAEQLDRISKGMLFVWSVPTFITCVAAGVALAFYPLNNPRMAAIRERLAVQRQEADAARAAESEEESEA